MADPSALRRAGLIVAMAAHVESTIPDLFPEATIDRLDDAAAELLDAAQPLTFETRQVLTRMMAAVTGDPEGRAWGRRLAQALGEALGIAPTP